MDDPQFEIFLEGAKAGALISGKHIVEWLNSIGFPIQLEVLDSPASPEILQEIRDHFDIWKGEQGVDHS